MVANGTIEPIWVPTNENIADVFTKALARPAFEAFRRAIGMTDSTAHIHRTSSSATPQSSRGNHGDEALESGGVLDKGSLS